MDDLEHQARQLLARASVIPEASAAAFDTDPVSHGKPGGKPPRIAGPSTYDELRWILRWPITEAKIQEAESILNRTRYSIGNTPDLETREGRTKIANDPRSPKVLADIYGISERHIYRIRAQFKKAA